MTHTQKPRLRSTYEELKQENSSKYFTEMRKLYLLENKSGSQWVWDKWGDCDSCHACLLGTPATVVHNWIVRKGIITDLIVRLYCFNCINSKKYVKTLGVESMAEYKQVLVTPIVPNGAKLRILPIPEQMFSYSKVTTFDIDFLKSETTSDKTLLAGRESFDGMVIGNQNIIKELQEKDKHYDTMTLNDGLKFLDGLASSTPALPNDSVKKIGDGERDKTDDS